MVLINIVPFSSKEAILQINIKPLFNSWLPFQISWIGGVQNRDSLFISSAQYF